MGQDTVDQLMLQLLWEARHGGDPLLQHLDADDDMAQELSLVGIIVLRERRQLLCLSDIMEHGGR